MFRATNALAKIRVGLQRATPVVHSIRKYTDVASSIANTAPGALLPGSGVVKTIGRVVGKIDDHLQKKYA